MQGKQVGSKSYKEAYKFSYLHSPHLTVIHSLFFVINQRERERERETERDREREREETAIRPENNSDNQAVVFPSGSSGKIGKERPDVKDTIEIPPLFINRDLG